MKDMKDIKNVLKLATSIWISALFVMTGLGVLIMIPQVVIECLKIGDPLSIGFMFMLVPAAIICSLLLFGLAFPASRKQAEQPNP